MFDGGSWANMQEVVTGWNPVINRKRNWIKSVFAGHCSLEVKCWSLSGWDSFGSDAASSPNVTQ